jgi:hypothetical protein
MYKRIIAVCSQIHTKHKYTVWAERTTVKCQTWRYGQLLTVLMWHKNILRVEMSVSSDLVQIFSYHISNVVT